MNEQEMQEAVNDRMDGVLDEVLITLKQVGPVEMIAVGTALILIGLASAPESEKSAAWQKLRNFLAEATQH